MERIESDERCIICYEDLISSKHNFSCENCKSGVHYSCIETKIPTELVGDIFFSYVCKKCSCSKTNEFLRQKLSWMNIITLALYNLQENSIHLSRYGFFHWKIHICDLIERNWTSLFGTSMKKKNWIGTVSGTLSHYSPHFFLSGQKILNESGWWKLSHSLTPAELAQTYVKGGSFSIPLTSQEQPKTSIDSGGDESADSFTGECSIASGRLSAADESDSQSGSCSSVTQVFSTHRSAMYSMAYVQPSETLSDCLFADDEEDESLLDIDVDCKELSSGMEMDSFHVRQPPLSITTAINEVFDSSTQPEPSTSWMPLLQDVITEEEIEEALPQPEKSLFTRASKKSPIELVKSQINDRIKALGGLPMGEYAEVKLLYTLRRAISSSSELPPASVYRLHRKLSVRKMKRERNLPVFNVDKITAYNSIGWHRPNSTTNIGGPERVLNRFKVASSSTVSVWHEGSKRLSFLCHLYSGSEPQCFRSPYTNRMLKPFIRRDHHSLSLWSQLMVELVETVRAKKPSIGGIPVPEYRIAPIDFSYIRPWHIPPINYLAREYFWPGIDLSDCLQYPDFSCVVLYRKLVVAFAVMVPDVRHNETYISFLFTRPEWRKAGIATFMLYHLIQTCMGKDITLHVSATNPALILYQKFGFKVEEFIQDFYEMYLPINSRECKHALFLRLSR